MDGVCRVHIDQCVPKCVAEPKGALRNRLFKFNFNYHVNSHITGDSALFIIFLVVYSHMAPVFGCINISI